VLNEPLLDSGLKAVQQVRESEVVPDEIDSFNIVSEDVKVTTKRLYKEAFEDEDYDGSAVVDVVTIRNKKFHLSIRLEPASPQE